MPTYQYECTKCGYIFERFQKMTDKPVSICPKCKGKVIRIVGPGGGFIFKGAGFYTTEYRSEEYKKRAKEEKQLMTSASSKSSPNSTGSDAPSTSTADKK
jgi:putative FmdB family regulatory protein